MRNRSVANRSGSKDIAPWIAVAVALILLTGIAGPGLADARPGATRPYGVATKSALQRLRKVGRVTRVLKDHVLGFRTRSSWLSPLNPGEVPVLMVHGVTSNPGVWRGLIAHLRGEGRTSLGVVSYSATTQDVATILAEVDAMVIAAQAKGHPRVALVGHSLGGIVAALYAAANPDRVAQIVTLASPLRPFDDRGTLDPLIGRFAGTITRHAKALSRLGGEVLVDNAAKAMDPIETGKVRRLIDGRLGVPVLSVVGQRDWFATEANSRAVGPGNRTEIVADDGHLSIVADPVVHRLVSRALDH